MSNPFALRPRTRRQGPRPRVRNRFRPAEERLEHRSLLSLPGVLGALDPWFEVEPNDTLDLALDLGQLGVAPPVQADGAVGNGGVGGSDVDWYRFQLDRPAHVRLRATQQDSDDPPAVVLSLYNSDPDDFGDPYTPLGHRLLAQADGADGLERDLGPGTFYAALSGSGNRFFHPFLADSGLEGSTGAYRLQIEATDRQRDAGDGPVVLAVDRDGAPDSSPFVIRVAFAGPNASGLDPALDPYSIELGTTVRLLYNADGTFGDGEDSDVPLDDDYNFTPTAQELQLFPAAPLRAGWYQLVLTGDRSAAPFVLTDPAGVPLGTDADHPDGQDYTDTFEVGSEGRPGPDAAADDAATLAPHDLGELPPGHVVQVVGAIGDDPYFDPTNLEEFLQTAWDVDLYHFRVRGPGRHAFTAEVFAGRFGSPLDPGVSLFMLDPTTGQLRFLDGNNNTRNPEATANGFVPLYTDALLFAGLTEGDYFVAVSSGFNTPTPVEGSEPGSNGIFDPNVSHSGQTGFSTGLYALNLLIQPDDTPPRVSATTPEAGATLEAPPTELIVRFNEPINLRRLSFLRYEQTPLNPAENTVSVEGADGTPTADMVLGQATPDTLPAVYVEGPVGTRYFPRLSSYDEATGEARFLMLDGLANGEYRLHLSGRLGLSDLAGHPLAGSDPENDPGGDYLVPFTVAGPPRGTGGDPLHWSSQEPNDNLARPQDLGILFPHELQAGITVTRDIAPPGVDGPTDTADLYRFQVIGGGHGSFTLTGPELPGEVLLTLTDAAGNAIPFLTSHDGRSVVVQADLNPGTYVLLVGTWSAEQALQVGYQLRLELSGVLDNPPPLASRPSPAWQFRMVGKPIATDPGPGPAPDPMPFIIPDPRPRPAPDPTPFPIPDLGPGPAPDPTPFPIPDPRPGPAPDPTPFPIPDPRPGPAPDPTPFPIPDLRPSPASDPTPLTIPDPGPGPDPDPTPLPIPDPGRDPGITPPPASTEPAPPSSIPADPFVLPPVAISTTAPTSSARAGTLPPAGTLIELAIGPLDGASSTSRTYTPLLADRPEVQVNDLPHLVVSVAAQLPFLTVPLPSGGEQAKAERGRPGRADWADEPSAFGGEEARAEPPNADELRPAGGRTPGNLGLQSVPSPVQIRDAFLAMLPRELALMAPSGETVPSPSSRRRAGQGNQEGTPGSVPLPPDEVQEAADGARRTFLELGMWCSALVGLGLAALFYGEKQRNPLRIAARPPGDDDRDSGFWDRGFRGRTL